MRNWYYLLYLLVLPDVERLVLRVPVLARAASLAAGATVFFSPLPFSAKPIPAANTVTAATAAPAITGTEEPPFLAAAAGAGLGAGLIGAVLADLGAGAGIAAAGGAATAGATAVGCSSTTTADGTPETGWGGISTGTR